MSKERFRIALGSKLGHIITPELATWLELNAFDYQLGKVDSTGVLAGMGMSLKLDNLIEAMLTMPQVECPVREYFAPGLYAREITIYKDTVLVGAIHKTQNLATLSKGRLRLVTDTGSTEIEGHCTLTVNPGGRNAALALEDSIWTNYFPTTETDPRKLVALLTDSTYDELLGGSKNRQLLAYAEQQKLEA